MKKAIKLILNIIGLFLCSGVDSRGLRLWMLNETHSLMHAIFVLFSCLGVYFFLMLLSMIQIRIRHSGETEIGMMGKFTGVLTGFAILIGIVYLSGRLDAFTTFFTMFGGLLLGWSLQAPVSGLAAWVMITLMRPYRIGDRVQFPTLALVGDGW